jgi:ABC-2 type transport system permease protein
MTPNPLWELTLTRLRLFFREPSAVFWTFGFPLALSLALGIAFRNRPPEPVRIGLQGSGASERLVRGM